LLAGNNFKSQSPHQKNRDEENQGEAESPGAGHFSQEDFKETEEKRQSVLAALNFKAILRPD
jgi:hypothetical protein